MKKEESFGIIPLKKEGMEWHVFLVYHQKGFWAFPKGHAEKGETPIHTAERELKEETGLSIERQLDLPPFKEYYCFKRDEILIQKSVTYFAALVKGTVVIQTAELADGKWVNLKDAEKEITFQESKAICRKVIATIGTY